MRDKLESHEKYMKSYKISQTVEKSIYPIEAKLDTIRDSSREYLDLIFSVYAPVFLSTILTICFGESIFSSCKNPSWLISMLNHWWGKIIALFVIFILFSFAIYGVIIIIQWWAKRFSDNKKTEDKRNRIAQEFYKVIIPDIITGVSLFEKAYEIECNSSRGTSPPKVEEGKPDDDSLAQTGDTVEQNGQTIDAEKIVLTEKKVCDAATLFYYEAFYQFKIVCKRIFELEIFEYKDSDRDEYIRLLKLIGVDGLRKAINLSLHCVKQIKHRIEDAEEDALIKNYMELIQKINS